MTKRKKLFTTLISIVLVLITIVLITYCTRNNRTVDNISNISELDLVDWGSDILSEQDIKTEEYISVFQEILKNRDRDKINQALLESNNKISLFEGAYLSTLLMSGEYNELKNEYNSVVNSSSIEEYKEIMQFFYFSINLMTNNDDKRFESMCNFLRDYDWMTPAKADYQLPYYGFMYFICLASNADKDICENYHAKFRQVTNELGLEYNKQFEIERLNGCMLLLSTKSYKRFENVFIISFDDREPFDGMDLSYIINAQNFNDEQKKVFCNALDSLKGKTDPTNYKKLSQIEALIEVLQMEE